MLGPGQGPVLGSAAARWRSRACGHANPCPNGRGEVAEPDVYLPGHAPLLVASAEVVDEDGHLVSFEMTR